MSNRLLQILASLAQRRALRTLDTICETQHQISTRKLGQYLEPIGDELAGYSFHLRMEYDALTSKIAQLEAELTKLRAGQEPVALTGAVHGCFVQPVPSHCDRITWRGQYYHLPITPQPSAVPDGWKLVPVERITIALESVQNAMGDAYNNAYQECCGRGQGQCCGEPVAAWSDADTAIMDALAPAQRELSALLAAAPSAPATVQGVNQQLLEALESMMRDTGLVSLMRPDQVERNTAAISAARKEGGKV